MQQTAKYQFNLVDSSDDFSPAPLNQNAQKMEDALEAHAAAVAEQLGDMDGSVAQLGTQLAQVAASVGTTGQNARIVWSSYAGTGSYGANNPNSLTCGFIPVAVLIVGDQPGANTSSAFLVRGCSYYEVLHDGRDGISVTWQANGLSWYATESAHVQLNRSGYTYCYLLIGYDAE